MEFKYRSIDKKPTTTSFPHSSVSYASESLLPDANNVLLRELKKKQIRWEIITGEIAWRHEMEAEVWRELALESSLGAPYSLQQQLNPTVVDSPVEIKPSLPHLDKDKVIVLPRPKPDHELHCAKRKAVAPVCDTEPSALGLSKKAKGKWSCALCQVNVTSEASFNKHLVGKKHKAKEASVTIGLDATPNKEPSLILEELNQTVVEKDVMESKNEERAQLVEKSQNVGGLENLSETEAGKRKTSGRKKVWCEVCQIYTLSKVVMETHKKGKKHQMQMMKLSQKEQ